MSYSFVKPLVNGKSPSGRGGCSAVHVDGKLVVFGGSYFIGDGKFAYLDETWVFDFQKVSWHKMMCAGEVPPPRYGHSAHIVGSRMFIFGGKGADGALFKDVYFLDLLEWIWVPVNTLSQGPAPRLNHASELVGRKLVIHGGWDGEHAFNDLWIFNTDSFAWMQPRVAGFAPSARFGHSLTLSPDGRLIIFGGCTITKENGLPRYLDDIRQLDTDTMIWTRPRVHGTAPTGRFGHSASIMNGQHLVVYGGWGKGGCQTQEAISNPNAHTIHTLDLTSMTWSAVKSSTKKPLKHLYNHACCAHESNLHIFGGYDGRQASFDYLNIDVQLS